MGPKRRRKGKKKVGAAAAGEEDAGTSSHAVAGEASSGAGGGADGGSPAPRAASPPTTAAGGQGGGGPVSGGGGSAPGGAATAQRQGAPPASVQGAPRAPATAATVPQGSPRRTVPPAQSAPSGAAAMAQSAPGGSATGQTATVQSSPRAARAATTTQAKTDCQISNKHIELIQGPPGSGKTEITIALLQVLHHMNLKVLLSAPKTNIVKFLMNLDKCLFPLEDALVLDNLDSTELAKEFQRHCLCHRSQDFLLGITLFKKWLREMFVLLNLDPYCTEKCDHEPTRIRCSTNSLLVFTLSSFKEKFTKLLMRKEWLTNLKERFSEIYLSADIANDITNLLSLLKDFEDLLCHDKRVQWTFGLSSVPCKLGGNSAARKLNDLRLQCVDFIQRFRSSLKLPKFEERKSLEDFCIKHAKHMLTEQYAIHPSIWQFPNEKFYEGRITNGATVVSPEYNKQFKGLKFPNYCFIDVTGTDGPSCKNTIELATIQYMLEIISQGLEDTEVIDVGVLCLCGSNVGGIKSSLDENTILQIEKINAALTRARHCLWMFGEVDSVSDRGGIFAELVHDVCTEFTWSGRPKRTKYILAPLRDQGNSDTCTMHSCLGAMESMYKHQYACLEPPQDFSWILSTDNLKEEYENVVAKEIGSEEIEKKGKHRLATVLEILKEPGVLGSRKVVSNFKIKSHSQLPIKEDQEIKTVFDTVKDGKILVGHFHMSENFFSLRPGDIYHYDRQKPYLNPVSSLQASHAVMIIGSGVTMTKVKKRLQCAIHLSLQNSAGRLFGENGCGYVGLESIRGLYQLDI
uniref:DNA2/NAM7 helicase-like C-terminal domain-containing protein n=1 Tax=Oryza glumipatula TaxID=40148 RepID=A0A0E0BLQ3_9ORYZ